MSTINALKHFRQLILDKKNPVNKALAHFDNFYGSIFKDDWPSIRLGLLTKNSYCAMVTKQLAFNKDTFINMGTMDLKEIYHYKPRTKTTLSLQDITKAPKIKVPLENKEEETQLVQDLHSFVPVTQMKYREEVISEKEYYEFYQPKDGTQIQVAPCQPINYPESWNIFVLPRGEPGHFPKPSNEYEYFLMDASSILPVLALDVQPGNTVLDLCAAPGGKTAAILLTKNPGLLVCNDKSQSRLKKLQNVLFQHGISKMADVRLSCKDATQVTFGEFDRVLVDAPCTNDRLSVNENRNNVFTGSRLKERRDMPLLQQGILTSGLKSLAPGGSLVYSTCSLSPIQNDGVVHMALQDLWDLGQSKEFVIQDLREVFHPLEMVFRFSEFTRYGCLVLPFVPQNYGPMYICKINRTK